jgi:hypothetical protein
MPRTYVPSDKHKWPKGFGSLCPKMQAQESAALLERAIEVSSFGGQKLWAARGKWCFCAHPSPQIGPEVWHGFPVIGGEVDERVLNALEASGFISAREKRRLRAQRELPEGW